MSGPVRSLPDPALPTIAAVTAVVESAFLSAGQGLSQGLSAFGALTERLAALGTALEGGGTATASADLGHLSRRLRGVADRMPIDAAALGRLIDGNRIMRGQFDDLVGDMRMMAIVSRSARLEAVVSAEQRASVEDFSRAIDREIGLVQARLNACAAEHGKITALLEQGARAQAAFDAEYGDRLTALAIDLDQALEALARRRAAGLALMAEAGARARGIAGSAGMALVSLQVGDTTRQRLEHILFALDRAETLADADAAGLLRRLQEVQLRDTAATFADESVRILEAFGALSRDTTGLVAVALATSGRGAANAASFMAAFRDRFDTARDLVAACDVSRASVERATAELGAMLVMLDGTLTTLGTTSEELVIVAVNVGLNATRLGSRGRGLVTVAGELKRLSEQLALQTNGLLSTFEAVRSEAGHFRTANDDSSGSPSLADAAASLLEALGRDDMMIAEVLAGVECTGREFNATMDGLSHRFEAVLADAVRLTEAADCIDADCPAPSMSAVAADAVDALMLPLYSMAQERNLHMEYISFRDDH